MFVVKFEDGTALGRYSLGGALAPVPMAMAYTFDAREDAEVAARGAVDIHGMAPHVEDLGGQDLADDAERRAADNAAMDSGDYNSPEDLARGKRNLEGMAKAYRSPLSASPEQRASNSAELQDRMSRAMLRVAADETMPANVRRANMRDARTAQLMSGAIREGMSGMRGGAT